jgi:hypothetical protein
VTRATDWQRASWLSHLPEPQVRVNQANDLRLSSADPERDLLDWLSKPHSNPDLVKANKEVLEQIGDAPGS